MPTPVKMSSPKYRLPPFLEGVVKQEKYNTWLTRKAASHVKRDQKFRPEVTQAKYKKLIHAAVKRSGGKDPYTGETLRWKLINTWKNEEAKKSGRKYKSKFALLPSIDHVADRRKSTAFRICSWRTNDAKNDLSVRAFEKLCEKVVKHMQIKATAARGKSKTRSKKSSVR